MDHEGLAAVAAGQSGAFSTAQALAAGWTWRQIRDARLGKRWRRLYEGAWVDESLWQSLDAEARALCQLRARLLVVSDDWHAARRSALLVHGLPSIGRPPAHPQLIRAPDGAGTATKHERIAPLPASDRVIVEDCRSQSVARAVCDVAREPDFLCAVVAADAALHRGLHPADLEEVASRCARWPGATRMHQVLDFADGRAESVFESLSRVRMRDLEIPLPELQLEIYQDELFVARTDFLWRSHNLVGEADGRSKYTSINDFYAEKRREEWLENLGFEVIRWDWDTAWSRPHALEATIQRGLRRGRLNALDPRVRTVPHEPVGRRAA